MKTKLSLILVLLAMSVSMSAQQLAFPSAQGWGRFATGGRTGTVYHVTNLNDSGSGSLRDAVSQPNRIVVFDVAGVIRINSRMSFAKNLYVAGQTAPGEGITVYGDGVTFSGSDNIIVRYMRFRMGAVGTKDKDAAGIANGQNMIFDHCSFSWGQDENFSINWDNKGTAPQNITLMNSIVGQGLMTHSAGGLMQADNITLYRILLVDNSTRNFKVKGTNQYVNNIVYNWKNYAYNMGGDSQGTSYVNIENNLFINGPAGGGDALSGGNSDFHFYGNDNWQDSNRDGVNNPSLFTGNGGGDPQTQSYSYPTLEKWAANDLIANLLPDVGASLPYRDIADCYMVDEVLSFGTKGKLITNENELPIGVPTTWKMYTGTKRTDTDNDGMPDDWENANGTNPSVNDAMTIASNGYANIENYINSITKEDRQFYLRPPMLPELADATPVSLTISWSDFTDNEEGFIVEMLKGSDYVEVGRTGAGVTSYTITDESLKPATAYKVRLCSFSGDKRSDYTSEITVKTRPEQTDIIDAETFDGKGEGEWLIAPTTDEVITLTEPTEKTAVVVRSDAHVTINGTGYISGSASMNKTGEGTLTIASPQQYTGATVLHKGTYEFSSLKNGGVASGLGMSQEFAQNWIMDGGVYKYTGSSTTTDRSATLYDNTELNISSSQATVTMNGGIEGQGYLIVNGAGTLGVNTGNFFRWDGNVVMKGGTLKLNSKEVSEAGIGTASKLMMQGGKFVTVGKNEASVTYNFPIEVAEGTESTVDFDLWNTNKCSVTGKGTLTWNVHYVREYIEGNWDNFTGKLIINGTGKAGQSQFALRNGVGVQNATITLKGNASINCGKTAVSYYIGGLSGDASTVLAGFNVKAKGTGTWIVGGANTDETFRGVINNNDQAGSHPGTTTIEKIGSGDWRLTGNNVYSGTTTVSKGRLIVNGTHSGTGAVTVQTGATLAGTGALAAATTVNTGATLQVGDTLVNGRGLTFNNTLRLNGTAALNVLANRTKSNTITLKGATTISSTAVLQINGGEMMEEAPYAETEYQIFKLSGGTITGTFSEIQPAIPGEGQTWDTSELYTKGILKVVGGEVNPDVDPDPTPEPAGETKTALLAWGNMVAKSYDNSGVNNMMEGAANDEAYGFSIVCTGNLTKAYTSGGNTPKMQIPYNDQILERTPIKCSNGAQNTVFMPDGAKATKVILYSVTGTNSSNRTSYWKEVAGVNYTESTTTVLDLDAPRDNPNAVSFTLNNVPDKFTFTNTGEQQCVIVYIEYHFGGADGIDTVASNETPLRVEYYTLSGQRIAAPEKGICIMRTIMQDGRSISRKIVKD